MPFLQLRMSLPIGRSHHYAILFYMRLTVIFLVLGMLHVSAAGYSQKVSVSGDNIPLKKVFQAIEKQTDYVFVYYETDIDDSKTVTLHMTNVELTTLLDRCLKDLPVYYSISSKTIFIKKKSPQLAVLIPPATPAFHSDSINIHGKVIDERGNPVPSVTITVKGTRLKAITDENGEFVLKDLSKNSVLIFSSINTEPFETNVGGRAELQISLKKKFVTLGNAEVSYFTGYQTLASSRATGSFVQIDQNLFNRAASSDVLDKLKGITNGLLFDQNSGNSYGITIRGKSTLFSSTQPLIVVDNFPYVGDINNLNPNDVESVTILKDAAAASIWGTSAGNGVIVITTKKGKLLQAPKVNFESNIIIGNKPDLYYQPQLKSADYISVEQYLFGQGYYDGNISSEYLSISPAVQILLNRRNGTISSSDSLSQLNALSQIDVRRDIDKYFLRHSILQQYNIGVSGGGQNETYCLTAGYMKNLSNKAGASNDRYSIKANNSYRLFDYKLRFDADLSFNRTSLSDFAALGAFNPLISDYPYQQLADSKGNPLAVIGGSSGLNSSYTDTAGQGYLLDWKLRPLDELRRHYSQLTNATTDYRANLAATYSIIRPLSISVMYQYYQSVSNTFNRYGKNSFFVRNLVNEYSQIDFANAIITRPIPAGDILNRTNTTSRSDYGRVQLNFNETFNGKHSVAVLGGYEVRDDKIDSYTDGLYGYDPNSATSVIVDYITYFPFYYGYNAQRIPFTQSQYGLETKNISYYVNLGYNFQGKYLVSGSLRKDESNLFGVSENQRGVPLGHFGLGWNMEKERFYSIRWLPHLKLSATYGYNGLVNNNVSALLTSSPFGSNIYNVNSSSIVNPPNPSLRWEKVKNINLGLEFSSKNDRVSGTIEYYIKNGQDLIGASPVAPQTGITSFVGNTANTHALGFDIQLNSTNVRNKFFRWTSNLILNTNKNKVTVYKDQQGSNTDVISSFISARINYPINSIFAFKWGGLDAVGNPQGYLNGKLSEDYASMLYSKDSTSYMFKGSAIPKVYGSLRNTFTYKFIDLSFNIVYKFDYYFRRYTLNYSSLFSGNYFQPDFEKRWQQSGDEKWTNVPSLIYPSDGTRDLFYNQSAVSVERADNIRLQDIRIALNFTRDQIPLLPFSTFAICLYVNNIAILWKANDKQIDPDAISGYPIPRTYSIGLKAEF